MKKISYENLIVIHRDMYSMSLLNTKNPEKKFKIVLKTYLYNYDYNKNASLK